jgi:predicted lipoprotein with Yx(FWY)xxD motif
MHGRHASGRLAAPLTATLGALALCAAAMGPATPAQAAPAWTGTVISEANGPYGQMLVVGSGRYKGFTLYAITSDRPGHYGCTTQVITVLGHHGTCTGPASDANAEWPAITTKAAPIAGNGVSRRLLGSVYRKHVGRQVTYAGHPLYLFDPKPGDVFGQGWDEPSLPPWFGVWWVVSPSGQFQPWAGELTTVRIGKRTVLAARMQTAIGYKDFPVYTYSKDTVTSSACYNFCAHAWPPMLTSSLPKVTKGIISGDVTTIIRSGGVRQVAYKGHPLYLYSHEGIVHTSKGYFATGNGNGVKSGSGVFELIGP